MRLLIVEDEKSLANIIKKGLEEEGYSVDVAYNGEDGLFMAENESYDLIILDIMLPVIDGITIVKKIRKKELKTPVLMLTARDSIMDKVSGLDSGADDYLTKPFSFEELLARIRALLRRQKDIKSSIIEIADLVIDTASHEVKRGGKTINLSSKEYALLEYMAYNKNKVLTKTDLIEHLYDYDFDCDSNIIEVFVYRLRNKIDDGFDKKLIHTIRGTGYVLRE
ncbi:heavy metal response regulator transcription factor [Thermodesulfovibrio sp. TK110]